jgi:hypothetical protein
MAKIEFKDGHFYYIKFRRLECEILAKICSKENFLSEVTYNINVLANNFTGGYPDALGPNMTLWHRSEGFQILATEDIIEWREVKTEEFPLFIGLPNISPAFEALLNG